MMRFLSSLALSAALLGAVAWCRYALTRNVSIDITRRTHAHDQPHTDTQSAEYVLEVTPAFDAVDDPFAVQVGEEQDTARLVIHHAEREIYRRTEDLRRGETVRIDDVRFGGDAVHLYIQAVPAPEQALHPSALRVQLIRDEVLCDETTLWSPGGGARVSGEAVLHTSPNLQTLDRGLGEGRSE
jgi:hypothetical protein